MVDEALFFIKSAQTNAKLIIYEIYKDIKINLDSI